MKVGLVDLSPYGGKLNLNSGWLGNAGQDGKIQILFIISLLLQIRAVYEVDKIGYRRIIFFFNCTYVNHISYSPISLDNSPIT